MQFHIFIIELQYQYLNYITGIPVLYKILKKIHNTGTNFYTSDRQVQEIRKFSYLPRTIRDWNSLPPDIVSAKTLDAFKAQVSGLPH